MSQITNYEIKLPQFEGPFDLLLFFIERDELEIQDIPITKITADFLEYIHHMEVMNIELASDFILFAATLMRIKAKMLLPRKEKDEFGNEIDPRAELIQKLMEYKRFKETLPELQTLEERRVQQIARGNLTRELSEIGDEFNTEHEIHSITLFKLLKAFDKVMNRMELRENQPQHTIIKYDYTIESQKEFLLHLTRVQAETSFERIFETCTNRVQAVFTFLAMLELIQNKLVAIKIGLGVNNFWIAPLTAEA